MESKDIDLLQFYNDIQSGCHLDKHQKKFQKDNPKIFKLLQKPDLDIDILKQFIKLQGDIKAGKLTQEKADIIFGQILADKYLPKNLK